MSIELKKYRKQIVKNSEGLPQVNQWRLFINQESLILLNPRWPWKLRCVEYCFMVLWFEPFLNEWLLYTIGISTWGFNSFNFQGLRNFLETFSLLPVIQFLWCYFREFGIGLTDNPPIVIFFTLMWYYTVIDCKQKLPLSLLWKL